MDGMTLLDEARTAGLTVEALDGRLVIRGPRRADAIARRLLAAKRDILDALGVKLSRTPLSETAVSKTPVNPDGFEGFADTDWAKRVAAMVADNEPARPLDPSMARRLAMLLPLETDPDWAWYAREIAQEGRVLVPESGPDENQLENCPTRGMATDAGELPNID